MDLPQQVTERQRDLEDQLRFQTAVVAAQAEASNEGVLVASSDGRILSFNARFAELWGISEATLATGSNESAVQAVVDKLVDPDAFTKRMAYLSEHLEEKSREEIALKDGRLLQRVTVPLRGEDGRIYGRIGCFRDITDKRKREEGNRFLALASKELAASLDVERNLSRVARLAVPLLADWCNVDLSEPDGSLRQLAMAHADLAMVQLAHELRRRHPPRPNEPMGVARVVRTGASELHPQIPSQFADGTSDRGIQEIVEALRLRSLMIVPIAAPDHTVGAITFGRGESGTPFSDQDLHVAEEVAARAAIAIDNARLYRERDQIARALQQNLLPTTLPRIPGIEAAARYLAAGEGTDVGGDFYDLFDTGDGGWAAVIGDVCGKGAAAAALMGLARHTIRTAAIRDRRPSEILTTLNEAVRQQIQDGRFCTACYVRIRPGDRTARLTVCSAGHPLPAVVRKEGNVEFIGKGGSLVGVYGDVELSDVAAELGPGDSLVLYTDGVTDEQRRGEEFGERRLVEVLSSCAGSSAGAIAARLDRAVRAFCSHDPVDDIAILALRVVS